VDGRQAHCKSSTCVHRTAQHKWKQTSCPCRVSSQHFHVRVVQFNSTSTSSDKSRENSAGIKMSSRTENLVTFSRARDFYIFHSIQTGSGAHLASYPMDTRGSFHGGKAAGVSNWTFIDLNVVLRSRMLEIYLTFSLRRHVIVLN
jgi:hypothetical protein